MKIFGLGASLTGAEAFARELGRKLSALEEREFEDGEFKIRPLESVRRESVVVYQSCAGSAGMSASDRLLRALIFAGALRDAGASEVTLVAPYLPYARKDRRTKSRDPVSTRYIAQIIEAVGIGAVVTVDVHNPAAFENAFRCRTQNVSSAELLAGHFQGLAGTGGRIVVVSPDLGGVNRARRFADLLAGMSGHRIDLAFVEKHRSEGRVSGDLFAGDVRDATVIVIDDMICGGTTLCRAASLCLERGARKVHAAATHGLFSAAAAATLGGELLASIIVTDTVPDVRLRARALSGRLVVLGAAPAIAGAVR